MQFTQLAEEHDPDLVLVGSRGLGGARAVLGSVSDMVVRYTPRPVLVAPHPLLMAEYAALAAGPVLLDWDGSAGAEAALATARNLFPGGIDEGGVMRNRRRTLGIVAAGVLTVGGAVAAPALAQDRAAPAAPTAVPMMGWRDRAGFCGMDLAGQPSGTLTATQRTSLRAVTERTRLAHDLYAAFADRYATFPAQLVLAETQQLETLRALLARYGEPDPMAGRLDPTLRAEYDRLRTYGDTSRAAALEVVRQMSRGTADLVQPELSGLTAPDVRHAYLHVLMAAGGHLRLAQAWRGR